jgi:hypothetical protein
VDGLYREKVLMDYIGSFWEARRIGDGYWLRHLLQYKCGRCGYLAAVPDDDKEISLREYQDFMRQVSSPDGWYGSGALLSRSRRSSTAHPCHV